MGFHLIGGTFNQAALATQRAGSAALCWLAAAIAFVVFVAAAPIDDLLVRTEVGYAGAALLLAVLLAGLYRRRHPRRVEG
jgi:hypothetical protein